jgi:hypothetical protein
MIIIDRVTARRTGRDRMIMEAPSKQVKAMRNITLIMLRMHPTPQEARATAGIIPACPWMPWCATRTVYRSLRRSHPDLRSPIDRKVIGGIWRYARADCHGLVRRGADYADR